MAGGSTSVQVDKANFVDVSGFDVADIKKARDRRRAQHGGRLERSVIKVPLKRVRPEDVVRIDSTRESPGSIATRIAAEIEKRRGG